jgi:hypothetical protein
MGCVERSTRDLGGPKCSCPRDALGKYPPSGSVLGDIRHSRGQVGGAERTSREANTFGSQISP